MLKSTVIQRHKSAPNKTLKLQSAGAAYWNTNTWGESNSINTASVQKNTYQIELQSGDTLQLEATTFGFDTIGSYPPINSLTAFAETRTCEAASPSCLTRLHPLFKS